MGRTEEFDAGHGKDDGDDYLAAVRRQAQIVMDYEKTEGRPMGEGSKYQGYNDQPIMNARPGRTLDAKAKKAGIKLAPKDER